MAEPFVFHFSPGPDVLYIADVSCVCGLCRHPQLQRFYHATPFHPMLPSTLLALAGELHLKASYECENCGTEVGPEHVERAVLRYGFPDDAGLLTIHVHDVQTPAPRHFYELRPRRRLDPQVQPTFEPDPEALSELDPGDLERAFSRVFNPKTLWRSLFSQWRAAPDGGAWAQAAPGYWLCLESSQEGLDALLEEVAEEDTLVSFPLLEAPKLPGHARALAGRAATWLDAQDLQALEEGRAFAEALVDPELVIEALARAFETARLSWEEEEEEDGGVFFTALETPREEQIEHDVSVDAVLQRAVHTGVTPGEAARLTAEEIVGRLLRVWK